MPPLATRSGRKIPRHRHCLKPSSYTAAATSGRWLDPTLLWGSLSLVLAVVDETWITEPRTKASAETVFFPWTALRCYCERTCDAKKKRKIMFKTKQNKHKISSWTSVLSWKRKHVMLESELCICSWSVASSCSLNEAAGFRECTLLHSTCCYASSETVKNT